MEKVSASKKKEKMLPAKISLLLPAAGTGSRMKADINKQYLMLKGKPLLAHTLEIFHDLPEIFEIIIATREEEIDYCQQHVLDPYDFHKVKKILAGGRTRQESVYQALKEVSSEADYVIVHDGARPFLSKKLAAEFVVQLVARISLQDESLSQSDLAPSAQGKQAVAQAPVGLVMAVPEKNTLKQVDQAGLVVKTVPRENIWEIQTPQAFKQNVLTLSFEKARELETGGDGFHLFTDDSSMVEALGLPVEIFMGSYLNLKMTTPEDLLLGERIMELIEDENKNWSGL